MFFQLIFFTSLNIWQIILFYVFIFSYVPQQFLSLHFELILVPGSEGQYLKGKKEVIDLTLLPQSLVTTSNGKESVMRWDVVGQTREDKTLIALRFALECFISYFSPKSTHVDCNRSQNIPAQKVRTPNIGHFMQ